MEEETIGKKSQTRPFLPVDPEAEGGVAGVAAIATERRAIGPACHAPKDKGTSTAQAAQASSGVTTQPETNPTGVARSLPVIIVNEDGSWEGGEEQWQIAW